MGTELFILKTPLCNRLHIDILIAIENFIYIMHGFNELNAHLPHLGEGLRSIFLNLTRHILDDKDCMKASTHFTYLLLSVEGYIFYNHGAFKFTITRRKIYFFRG